MPPNSKYLRLANAIIFGVTIVGLNLANSYQIGHLYQILLSLVFSIIYFAVTYSKSYEKIFAFDENSPKFYRYFKKWYSQEGTLSIYCTDLDWLNNDLGQSILYELKKKGNAVTLFLKQSESKMIRDLKEYGVKVFPIKDNLLTEHRLSILSSDGIKRIIIRNKSADYDAKKILFIETTSKEDPYLISLAEDLLEFCKS